MRGLRGDGICDDAVPKLVERTREYATRLGEAVISEGEDSGVIMLSHDAPTQYDATLGCHVYLHDHFSPLGDHLVRLHRDMIETVGPKGELCNG